MHPKKLNFRGLRLGHEVAMNLFSADERKLANLAQKVRRSQHKN